MILFSAFHTLTQLCKPISEHVLRSATAFKLGPVPSPAATAKPAQKSYIVDRGKALKGIEEGSLAPRGRYTMSLDPMPCRARARSR